MRHRALQLLAICCLVALAGCTGGLPGGDEPTLDDVSYPDGVSENGTNVSALSTAHSEALENESFGLTVDASVNASSINQSIRIDAAVGADRDNIRADTNASGQQTSMYLTPETRYTRVATDDGVTYDAQERTPTAMQLVPASYSGASYLDQFAGMANATPTDVREVNGTTLVVLEADGSTATDNESANLVDYNATLLVDEQGVVHSMTVELAATSQGQRSTTRLSMDIYDVGETTVEDPSWLDEARNRTGE
ncbi:DUF7537 family lipoprotein [Halorussus litoreus]|uniref:DUF7537 family lipoprotein n=1 Tax=Halorussus litoreus TaxID=1710536 RepID=UPI000E229C43|nr:hypothetical protein [Halorussus litoreus]